MPEEISKVKNLATAGRMKCPRELFKCLMETNVWEEVLFLRPLIWNDSLESRKPGGGEGFSHCSFQSPPQDETSQESPSAPVTPEWELCLANPFT